MTRFNISIVLLFLTMIVSGQADFRRIALNARYEAALSPRDDIPVIPGKLANQSATAGIRIRIGR